MGKNKSPKSPKTLLCLGGPYEGKVVKVVAETQQLEIQGNATDEAGETIIDPATGMPSPNGKVMGQYKKYPPKGVPTVGVFYWHDAEKLEIVH